jgi:hypothetical protein
MSRCGHMKLDSSVCYVLMMELKVTISAQQLFDIVFIFVDIKEGRYRVRVNNLFGYHEMLLTH